MNESKVKSAMKIIVSFIVMVLGIIMLSFNLYDNSNMPRVSIRAVPYAIKGLP